MSQQSAQGLCEGLLQLRKGFFGVGVSPCVVCIGSHGTIAMSKTSPLIRLYVARIEHASRKGGACPDVSRRNRDCQTVALPGPLPPEGDLGSPQFESS